MAVSHPVMGAAQVQRVLSLQALLALPQAQADESGSLQAWSLRVQQVLPLEVPPSVHELGPWTPRGQPVPALGARSALPQARRKSQEHSVSPQLVPRSLA